MCVYFLEARAEIRDFFGVPLEEQQKTPQKTPKQQTQWAYSHLSYNLTFYVLLLKNACSLQIVSLKTYVLSV